MTGQFALQELNCAHLRPGMPGASRAYVEETLSDLIELSGLDEIHFSPPLERFDPPKSWV